MRPVKGERLRDKAYKSSHLEQPRHSVLYVARWLDLDILDRQSS